MPPSPSSSRSSASEPGRGAAAPGSRDRAPAAPVIRVRGLVTRFGARTIHEGLDLDVRESEVLGVVGGSGTGKSVLLRTIVGLIRPAAGEIEVFGRVLRRLDDAERRRVEGRWGVLFQDGALFSSMTVAENVMVPMKEHLELPRGVMEEIAALKLAMVGLPR